MAELTERQAKILKSVVDEYIETAEPVGSETLEKKYSLGVSPATIRNEMAALTETGFLRQPHTSAGRVPTQTGFKIYITQLMEEKKPSVTDEVAAKEAIWDYRHEFDRFLREATRALANQTQSLAVAATKEGDVYSAGYSHILEMPEFYDIDVTKSVLDLLDEFKKLEALFEKSYGDDPIHILLGEDMGQEFLQPCGMVFTNFEAGPKHSGSIGVIGPCRLNYPSIVPTIRYFGELISELAKGW